MVIAHALKEVVEITFFVYGASCAGYHLYSYSKNLIDKYSVRKSVDIGGIIVALEKSISYKINEIKTEISSHKAKIEELNTKVSSIKDITPVIVTPEVISTIQTNPPISNNI